MIRNDVYKFYYMGLKILVNEMTENLQALSLKNTRIIVHLQKLFSSLQVNDIHSINITYMTLAYRIHDNL